MLNLSDLRVDIGGSRILDGVSLSVERGELVCLVGRNGAGKTTTFRTIMGYRRPVSGRITFEGADLSRMPTWRIAQAGIGFAPEESEVYGDLTVAENIELATWTRPQGRPGRERVEEAYAVFPKLRQYLTRGGMQLSGGERKMVSIARALALDPNCSCWTNPFEGLSPASSRLSRRASRRSARWARRCSWRNRTSITSGLRGPDLCPRAGAS
jgi:branched-chain amino acid transport system ATP-binding protein